MTASASGPLKLKAIDLDDLAVLAACLQDSIVSVADCGWLREDGTFVLVVNRFRWEAYRQHGAVERVHCAVEIHGVRRVSQRGVDPRRRDMFHMLLTLAADRRDDGTIISLVFSGEGGIAGPEIRLDADRLEIRLADYGEPWPAQTIPAHPPLTGTSSS